MSEDKLQPQQKTRPEPTQRTKPAAEGDATAHVEVQPLKHENAATDFASDQSFPASDPPAITPIRKKDHDAGSQ